MSRLATIADLTVLSSAVASLDTGVVQFYLDMAATSIDIARWGTKALYGHTALTMHSLTEDRLITPTGARGILAGRKFDDLQETYATGAVSGQYLQFSSTTWGRQYVALLRSIPRIGVCV